MFWNNWNNCGCQQNNNCGCNRCRRCCGAFNTCDCCRNVFNRCGNINYDDF